MLIAVSQSHPEIIEITDDWITWWYNGYEVIDLDAKESLDLVDGPTQLTDEQIAEIMKNGVADGSGENL